MEKRRINKFLADSGYCSRREADRLISEGKVKIDGRVSVLGDTVDGTESITVNGVSATGDAKKIYIVMNKPRGIVCTADTRERMNVVDYLKYPERVYPVGRLDKESEGLLIMTNDGNIVNKLLRSSGGHEREYEVTVDKPVTEEFLKALRKGVPILDVITLSCKAEKTGEKTFRITLVQGLNRQIRRMCEYLRYNVVSLRRIRIMNIRLNDMRPGNWRELTKDEVNELIKSIE